MTTDMTLVEGVVSNIIPVALRNIVILIGALIWMVWLSPNLTGVGAAADPGPAHPALPAHAADAAALGPRAGLFRRGGRLRRREPRRAGDGAGLRSGAGDLRGLRQCGGAGVRGLPRPAPRARPALGPDDHRDLPGHAPAPLPVGGGRHRAEEPLRRRPLPAPPARLLCGQRVKDLSELWGQVQKASGAAERIAEMMDLQAGDPGPGADHPHAAARARRHRLRGRQLRLPRPQRPPGAERLHPACPARGAGGAGRSVGRRQEHGLQAAAALLRSARRASIRMDGVDVREADPAELRERIALVAQDAPLFSGSAAGQHPLRSRGRDAEEVSAAALAAQAEGFLSALPQRPRQHRRRARQDPLRRPAPAPRHRPRPGARAPILLLDEATSALDAENERLVQQALHEAMSGRTTLVIAHRLATVLEADRIVVMEAGRVVEEGRHGDLIARGGLYAKLARLQFGAEAA